jgi:hypothetical protein
MILATRLEWPSSKASWELVWVAVSDPGMGMTMGSIELGHVSDDQDIV